jgi:hypothetical protein
MDWTRMKTGCHYTVDATNQTPFSRIGETRMGLTREARGPALATRPRLVKLPLYGATRISPPGPGPLRASSTRASGPPGRLGPRAERIQDLPRKGKVRSPVRPPDRKER